MRALSMNRWTSTDRENFSIWFDSAPTNPSVTVEWWAEGQLHSATMTIEKLQGRQLDGWIAGNFSGDFRVNRLYIYTDEGNSGIEVENGESWRDDSELLEITYDDPIEVIKDCIDVHWGGTVIWEITVNRLLDRGSSGLVLLKNLAEGWDLPGALTPQPTTEEQLQEALAKPYSEDNGNRCMMVGSEIVFLRSYPSGNEAIRLPASSVYTWDIREAFNNSSKIAPTQAAYYPTPYEGSTGFWTDFQEPYEDHFSDELEASFLSSVNDYDIDILLEDYPVRELATKLGTDRLASESYSYLAG